VLVGVGLGGEDAGRDYGRQLVNRFYITFVPPISRMIKDVIIREIQGEQTGIF